MSNIYIQEPPTNGKVILKTTVGEIEVELWSKECPKTCRNFVQLCMEGYYNGTLFHRVVKDFIAQGGDPTGTGQGGESIYGEPFKDEFHSRLRFNRRGLLGMANADKDDNASQFFFTLGNTPELTKKHTLFAKVVGNTVYNMIKLNECEVIDERPFRPEKIISVEIITNPFNDIVPRNLKAARISKEEPTKQIKGVKNYGLLSFGDEAEDDEDELESATKVFKPKAKSAHDIGDPTLLAKLNNEAERNSSSSDESIADDEKKPEKNELKEKVNIDSIKSKLSKSSVKDQVSKPKPQTDSFKSENDKEQKRKQTQLEIMRLEKELSDKKKHKTEEELKEKEKEKEKKEEIEVVKKYKEDVEKYETLKKKKSKNSKEDKTLEMLQAFRERLFKAKKEDGLDEGSNTGATNDDDAEEQNKNETTQEKTKESIWTHKLEIEEDIKQKVIDANIADHDRYDIFDPRNPLNKRKREESKEILKEKKRSSSGVGGHSRSSYDRR